MPLYLFLLSIGPVQRFIAGARKTSDLYNSSRLLSDLTGCAVNFIESNYKRPDNSEGPDTKIIYPQKEVESKPNRLVAQILTDNPAATGKNIELRIRTELKMIAEEIYKIAFETDPIKYPIETYKEYLKQIENHLEILWVFYLPKEEPESYPKHHKKIESLLGSVKNVRPFAQLVEAGRKCALTGEHNALFIGNLGKETQPAYFSGISLRHRLIGKKETLGGIGLIKRFYHEYLPESPSDANKKQAAKTKFPSITEITHLHLSELASYQQLSKKLKKYADVVDLEYAIYEPVLPEKLAEELDGGEAEFREIQALHQAFYKELKEKGKNPTKYYALLMFDGDSMGKWLGAENCKPDVKKECLQEYHENFSTLLGDYGKEATAYLDGANAGKALGKTVYAGGDDFLGFINLAYLWETLKELRTLFEQKVNQKLEHYKKPEANLTFSAGVVIAHYKQPLQQIVELCRSQEKKAKEFGSGAKNALAVVVSKHAGDAVEFAIPWRWGGASSEAPSGAANMIDCILELREFFRKQQLSKNFIHTVGRLLESLEQNDPVSPQENKPSVAPIDMDKELLKSLFRYALKRNPEKGNPADSQKLETLLLTAWEAAGKNGASFIAMLQTIDFIERQL